MRRSRTAGAALCALAVVASLAAGCEAEVERLDDKTRPTGLAAPNEGITPVRAERPGALVSGYLATAAEEDLLLASEHGRYLFERNEDKDFQRAVPAGAWILPGALVDAVGTSGGNDGLIGLTTGIVLEDGLVRPIAFDEVRIADGSKGGAVLAVDNISVGGATFEVETRAVLARDLPHLILKTTVRNTGEKPATLRAADRLQFGPGPIFAGPAGPRTTPGQASVPWIGHESLPEAYGYTIDGTTRFDAFFHVADRGSRSAGWAVDAVSPKRTLAPGQELEFVRRFRASGKGLVDVRAWLAELAGKPVGNVRGRLAAARELEPGAFRLALYDGQTLFGHIPVESSLAVDAAVPAGDYRLVARGPWGLSAPAQNVAIASGKATRLELAFGELGQVQVQIRDERGGKLLPATVVVTDLQGEPIWLGHTGRGAANGPYLHLPTGQGTLWLPPGKVRLTATRGPEYTIASSELNVAPRRDDQRFDATLSRKLDTDGYVLADLRAYSQADVQGVSPLEDLASAMVTAGVEFAVVTNRQRPTLLEDGARRAGLGLSVRSAPGQEMSPVWPHFGTFTLIPAGNPGAGRSGAPLWATSPEPFFEDVRKLAASTSPFVQVTWPRTPSRSGYFDVYNLDRGLGVFTRQGGSHNFDGVELLSGGALGTACLMSDPEKCTGDQQTLARALDDASRDWAALVSQGYRFTATASSGSAHVGLQPVGLPFTWVDVGRRHDATDSLSPAKVIDALRAGQAVISTGPILRFTIKGKGLGNVVPGVRWVTNKEGKRVPIRGVEAKIEVEAMDWVDVSEVSLYEDGTPIESWEIPPVRRDDRTRFEATVTVKPEHDAWYHVRVYGKKPLPTVPHIAVKPFAMTNPIWVDGTGDGKWEAPDPNVKALE